MRNNENVFNRQNAGRYVFQIGRQDTVTETAESYKKDGAFPSIAHKTKIMNTHIHNNINYHQHPFPHIVAANPLRHSLITRHNVDACRFRHLKFEWHVSQKQSLGALLNYNMARQFMRPQSSAAMAFIAANNAIVRFLIPSIHQLYYPPHHNHQAF